MKSQHLVGVVPVLAGLFLAGSTTLQAQQTPGTPQTVEGMEWNVRNLRPSGMPVIPMFDGWIDKGNGTADLCFGYFNLNLEQTLDIPVGPDNFVEPARFNGSQPTHFREVPPRYRRYFCVFSVNVPMGSEPVVWTLRHNGRTFSVPGHTDSSEYVLENIFQPSRDALAPLVRLVEPVQGPEGLGRGVGVRSGPVQATVGDSLTLTVSAIQPEMAAYEGDPKSFRVYWLKYSGPGDVGFSSVDTKIEEGQTTVSTKAAFSEPGNYVVLVQGFDADDGSFGMQCCWTTMYVDVTVAP